jgi:phosphoribosylaminoimidazole carboxylase (NCAIR synthetase)
MDKDKKYRLVGWVNCIKIKELDQAIFAYEKVVSRPLEKVGHGNLSSSKNVRRWT